MKKLSFLMVLFCFSARVFAQIPVSQEGTVEISCGSPQIFTDSNTSGNYDPNENYTITFCPEAGAIEVFMQLIISPGLFSDHIWGVDPDAELYIYDGPGTGSPLIGVFNSETHPDGIYATATDPNSGCLTISFISGASVAEGWLGSIGCAQPYQPFNVHVNTIPERVPNTEEGYVDICPNDSVVFTAVTEYPLSGAGGNGYEQSDETSNFRWVMGDGTVYEGIGLTQVTHTYTSGQGFLAALFVTDEQGRQELHRVKVRVSTTPTFATLDIFPDTICFGDTITLVGGILGADTVGFGSTPGAITGGGIFGNPLFLPDGNSEIYSTSIDIFDFEDDQVIESADNIVSVCVEIEHSYIGDLEMALVCPSGEIVAIFDTYSGAGGLVSGNGCGGGGTFLGDATDSSSDPGVGFTYCFEMDATGTICDNLGNTVPVSEGNAIAEGSYLPEDSFENFVGCPINGEWQLQVMDNLFIDDGYIFSWSIEFSADLDPYYEVYQPVILESGWDADPSIVVADLDTALVVTPNGYGPQQYTFSVLDDFGCGFDTTVTMYVYPEIFTGPNDLACNLTYDLIAFNAPFGGFWSLVEGPGTAVFTPSGDGGTTNVVVSDLGDYTFLFTDSHCGYQTSIEISFLPDPQAYLEDNILCAGASLVLDPGEQLPGDNFSYSWTQDGSVVGNNSTLEVTESGVYEVEVSGFCGDTTAVAEIFAVNTTLNAQSIVCGLEVPITGTLSLDGPGTWTSDQDSVIFSPPNEVNTTAIVPEIGTYEFSYTDDRCPDEPETVVVTFSEQPEIEVFKIMPEDVCPGDILVMHAVATGSFTENYSWMINNTGQTSMLDTLFIDTEELIPLNFYDIKATVIGEGGCLSAEDTYTFQLLPCEYEIPNVMTPNNDDKNDVFYVEGLEFFLNSKLVVFNRWGNVVYEETNYNQKNDWDGGDVPDGTYYYELTLPLINKVETGTLTILR